MTAVNQAFENGQAAHHCKSQKVWFITGNNPVQFVFFLSLVGTNASSTRIILCLEFTSMGAT
jgi:hypothetical protein